MAPTAELYHKEQFGPVVPVCPYRDEREFLDFVDKPRNLEVLQARLKEKLHHDLVVRFTATEQTAVPTPPPPPAATAVTPRESARSTATPAAAAAGGADSFRADPLIQKALEIFKATIVEVKK